jgi:hypothetical protein
MKGGDKNTSQYLLKAKVFPEKSIFSQVRWCMPVISATREAKARESGI